MCEQPKNPQSISVSVEGFTKFLLRPRNITVVSYVIRVKQEEREWVVYHTDEQFKSLDNVLHKKSGGSMTNFRRTPSRPRTQSFAQKVFEDAEFLWHEAVQPTVEGFLWKRTANKPSLEGFLWKKAAINGIKAWNRRYFKLIGNTLFYSNESTSVLPKRSVHLLDASMIVPSNETQQFGTGLVGGETLDGRASFEIRMPSQTVYLNAPSRDLMETWVAKLNTAKRNRYSQSPPMRPRSINITDLEMMMYEQKRHNYDIFLNSLCEHYVSSEHLDSFLLGSKYPNEKYPQYRMMVDAIQSNFALIVDLHETHGVPLDFEYKEVPFFHEACGIGAKQLVQYFLTMESEQSMANLMKQKDKYGKTPLHFACGSACYEVANILIQNGATVDVVPNQASPLHYIVRCGEPIMDEFAHHEMETLAKSLAPKCLNAKDEYGQTPLHVCVKKLYLGLLTILLALGADYFCVDSSGKNVLHLVACSGSAKAHAVMGELLQYMGKNVRTLSDFSRNMSLLEYSDNENQTALQCASDGEVGCFRHVTLMQQHHSRLEEYRFSMLVKDFMQQTPNIVISEDKTSITAMGTEFGKIFAGIIEFLCSSCTTNDYHSDIVKLIEKILDLCERTFNVIRGLELEPVAYKLLEEGVMVGIYPVLHSLFLKKSKFMDSILNQNLLLFKENVDHVGFGIADKLWVKINPEIDKALEVLKLVPTKVQPQDKLNCVMDAISLFDCDGADDVVPCLAYIMAQGADILVGVRWTAELDFISKLFPSGNYILLQGMLTFFQTATMKKKNGVIFVEGVDALATNTSHDLACLWSDLKRDDDNAMEEMQAVYSMFLKCANNFSGANQICLEYKFSDVTLNNHYMKSILTRLQIVLTNMEKRCWVRYGDFVDQSIFAKIASSFSSLPIYPSH